MNEGLRRIFYDNLTGERIIEVGRGTGMIVPAIERDIEIDERLSFRNRDTFDVLELPFGAYSQDFAECGGYRVNPTTKELEFAPKPITPEEPLVFQKPLSEQIAEVKAENELLKIRDAGMQEDINFIYETLGG